MKARAVRVLGWGLGDQAISSVTNFAILVLVARTVGPLELGVFAIFMAGYSTVTYINESLVAEPFVVRHIGPADTRWRSQVAGASGCAIVFGLACAAFLAAASAVAQGSLQRLLIVGAVCAPGLMVQDAMRFAFFAGARQRSAFLNDLAWAILQLCGYMALHLAGSHSLGALVATWAGAGASCGAIALWQARVAPRPVLTGRWLREHRDLWGFILLERLSGQGAMYLSLIGIAAMAGLAAVAAVRAAQALFGPLYITLNAARIVLLPSLVSASPERRRRRAHLAALGLFCLAGIFGAAVAFMPSQLGGALFGSTWPLAAPLLGYVALDRMAGSAAEAWRLGLLSGASVRRSLGARIVVAVALVAGSAAGAALDGARGAVIAGALIMPLGAALFCRQFLVATHRARIRARMASMEWVEPRVLT